MAEEEIRRIEAEIEWEQFLYSPIVAPYADVGAYPVYTESTERKKCQMSVFVQGDLNDLEGKTVFLTVHDVGKTYYSFVDLVNSRAMAPIKERAVFLHVCVPGQEPGAKDFRGSYPTVDQLADALAQLMGKLNLSKCVAIGEGAGADIVCRFAMDFHNLVLGLVLVHCTSTTHGIIAHIKELFMNLRLDDCEMNHSAWNWLLVHKYGNHHMDEEQRHYIEAIKAGGLNEHNLSRYLYAFSHREDFTDRLKDKLAKVDVLLVTGGKAPHNDNIQHMFEHMVKPRTGMLVAEGVVDVLAEAPDYIAAAIILLGQRHGIFVDLLLPIIKQHPIQNPDEPHQERQGHDPDYPITNLVFQA